MIKSEHSRHIARWLLYMNSSSTSMHRSVGENIPAINDGDVGVVVVAHHA
jgi:hypothetical protein